MSGRLVWAFLRRLWVPYALLMLFGLVRFLIASPIIETPRFSPSHVEETGNLAHLSRGTVLRVSSFNAHRSHHPLFAIDGDPRPDGWMMWASAERDRAPWMELALVEPRDVDRIVLDFVGVGEWPENALPAYTIECRRDGETVSVLEVVDNTEIKPEHALACPSVDEVRVDFAVAALGEPFSIVRLYEVELSGSEGPP